MHGTHFSFTELPPDLVAERAFRYQASRSIQPPSDDHAGRQARCFARKKNEDRLRHIFGQMRIAHLAHRRRINHVHVPPDQRFESLLRPILNIFPQQKPIIHGSNSLPVYSLTGEKGTSKSRACPNAKTQATGKFWSAMGVLPKPSFTRFRT